MVRAPSPTPDLRVGAHVARLRDWGVTVSVGQVAPARVTRLVEMFLSYEDVRDAWVFSCPHWQHYFGRPKNMAIARRRFETHGPFVEVVRGADSKLVQRVHLFRETLEQRSYGPLKAATLLLGLGAGILVFRLGGLAGAVSRRRHA